MPKPSILLVPRTQEVVEETAQQFRRLPLTIVPLGLFRVHFLHPVCPPFSTFSGALATSKNGIQALARRHFPTHRPLGVVGKASEEYAHSLGYKNCLVSSTGSAEGLLPLFKEHCEQHRDAHLLYSHGDKTRYALDTLFGGQGLKVTPLCTYRLEEQGKARSVFLKHLLPQPWGVVVLSLRVCGLLNTLFVKEKLQVALRETRFFFLSETLAAQAHALIPSQKRVARHPTLDSLCEEISTYFV